MGNLKKQLRQYPLVPVFFVFLLLFSLIDTLQPAKEHSELENRKLQQAPEFKLEQFLNNQWTLEYGEYVKDQLLWRDGWISTHSAFETAQGKLENNGVFYAKNNYQIAENKFYTDAMEQRVAINTTAVSQLAARFPGRVSAMVVPSPANVLSDALRWNPPQMDENAVLDGMYAEMVAAGADVIDLRDVYAANLDTQLFYYTDHHWTTTGGARLAYEAFCARQGLQPAVPSAPLVQVEDFYGTNFAKTKRLGTKADVLEYYDIQNPLTVYSYGADGALAGDEGPVMEKEKLAEYDKYGAFLRGNNGYSVLRGNGEGSILVIKDSYGNSFVPYLTENYATIGVIDLRAWAEIDSLVEAEGYDHILVLYCFESFATDTNAYRMMDDTQG